MKLVSRYKKLTLWNKIALWGAIASIIGIPLSIIFTQINQQAYTINIVDLPSDTVNKENEKKSNFYSSVNCPSPTEIYRKINSGPDLNRKAIANSYIGQKVEWICKFNGIFTRPNGIIRILCKYEAFFPGIDFYIKSADYPNIIRLDSHKENFLKVKGTIEEYSFLASSITLDVTFLKIYEDVN